MSQDTQAVPLPIAHDVSTSLIPHRSNLLAIVEGTLLLGGLAVLNHLGIITMSDWPVHPFMFVVLLLGAQYGIQGGVLAAVAAIALSHIDGWPARPVDMSYATYFRLAWADSLCWVAAGLIVGVVTSRQSRALKQQTALLLKSRHAENLIAAQYQVLALRTHKLERKLASLAGEGSKDTSLAAKSGTETETVVPLRTRNTRKSVLTR